MVRKRTSSYCVGHLLGSNLTMVLQYVYSLLKFNSARYTRCYRHHHNERVGDSDAVVGSEPN